MRKKYLAIAVLAIVVAITGWLADLQPALNQEATAQKFEFALIGDLPYDAEQEAKFPNLIADINQNQQLVFIVHDGDIKGGSVPCTDELFHQRQQLFQTFAHPFILIFGDNEWTDCHREAAGNYNPIERLAKIREIFAAGDRTLGQRPFRLTRQSENSRYSLYRENVRWDYGNALFVGLNIPGSNNNFGRTPEADREYFQRNAANLAWLKESFALAKRRNLAAVMLIIQANPGFDLKPDRPERTGYNDFLAALEAEVLGFQKPVVLVHGDSHYFRIDKPLLGSQSQRRIENFTRVETFGSPDVHWLRVRFDSENPSLFEFEQKIVPKNLVNHQFKQS